MFIFIFLLVVLWLLFRPVNTRRLKSSPHPVSGYPEAVARLESQLQTENGYQLHDVCRTKLLTHGAKTSHVIVLLHGYTNCPEQFSELGTRFYNAGSNVLIPCMPQHGRKNRLTNDLEQLTAGDMASFGDWAVDVARGLGETITVFGISGGGTIAAWLGQNRSDVDIAVPLSGFFGINLLPGSLNGFFINLFMALPHFYIWWDPRTKEKNPYSTYYAYPRYSFRTLAQVLRLAMAVKEQARRKSPEARSILMIINDFDRGVSNREIESLLNLWKQSGHSQVFSYHFEKSMKMLHDIITPDTPGVPTPQVYDRLIEQIQMMNDRIAVKTVQEDL